MRKVLLAIAGAMSMDAMALDVEANHCEVFVDKVGIAQGSHGVRGATFFLKTLNDRLDGPLQEVGIHYRSTIDHRRGQTKYAWATFTGAAFFGASDYFEIPLPLGSNYEDRWHEAVFYAKTATTTYWIHPHWESEDLTSGHNFHISSHVYGIVSDSLGGRTPYRGANTESLSTRGTALSVFNPKQCF